MARRIEKPTRPMMHSTVVHVIDDDEAVRQSTVFLLASAGFPVRLYPSATEFLAVAATLPPGCVISDVRMPGIDGLELQRRLQGIGSHFPLILMTGNAEVPLAVQAMKAGAVDFIEKPFESEALLAAVGTAVGRLEALERENAELEQARARFNLLSVREKEVLDGLLAGQANKVIAYHLRLSPRTVEVYRANVMSKMHAGSLSELIRMALLAGHSSPGA